MANQQATGLIDSTVQTFNGDVSSVSTVDGISLIDNWVTALRSDNSDAQLVASTLNELKQELQNGNPDTDRIKTILDDLATQTEEAARTAEDENLTQRLDNLAQGLRAFGHSVTGDAQQAGDQDFMQGKGQAFTQTGTGSATGNAGAMSGGASGSSEAGNVQGGGAASDAINNGGTGGPVQGNSTREGGGQSGLGQS